MHLGWVIIAIETRRRVRFRVQIKTTHVLMMRALFLFAFARMFPSDRARPKPLSEADMQQPDPS